jgi:hypothetical protein
VNVQNVLEEEALNLPVLKRGAEGNHWKEQKTENSALK